MIESARLLDGASPADDFIQDLERSRKPEERDLAAGIAMAFEDYADGRLEIPRELNTLRDGIEELKIGVVRLPFFKVPGSKAGAIRLTHGFIKKSQKTPMRYIRKAIWVRDQDGKVDERDG